MTLCTVPGCVMCAVRGAPVVIPGLPQRDPGELTRHLPTYADMAGQRFIRLAQEEPMRHRRPDYVHPGARWVPLELAAPHRRAGFIERWRFANPIAKFFTIFAVALAVVLLTAAVALADDPVPQEPPRPDTSSTAPKQDVPPPPCPPDEC